LDHTDDEDDDDQKMTFVPSLKLKQETSPKSPPGNIMDVSAVSTTGPPAATVPPGSIEVGLSL